MGKIVKFCESCEEGFAERFSCCPNCAQELTRFEMKNLNAKESSPEIDYDVFAEDLKILQEDGREALDKRIQARFIEKSKSKTEQISKATESGSNRFFDLIKKKIRNLFFTNSLSQHKEKSLFRVNEGSESVVKKRMWPSKEKVISKDWTDSFSDDVVRMILSEIENNSQACKSDQIPQGFGEFGTDLTNPIPIFGIPSSEDYLSRLRTAEGQKIRWKRLGNIRADNIESPIDTYQVFNLKGVPITTIYISPYHWKTSTKAPKYFRILN